MRCIERPYHIACLKCGQCQKVLGAGDEIYKKNDQPHCADCVRMKNNFRNKIKKTFCANRENMPIKWHTLEKK